MFGKYNIDDLFIAYINLFYIKRNGSLEYYAHSTTILKKVKEDQYINLKNGEIVPSTNHPIVKEIAYIEPLSNYYDQDGKKKVKVSKKKAIERLKENYNSFNKKCDELGKTYVFTKKK